MADENGVVTQDAPEQGVRSAEDVAAQMYDKSGEQGTAQKEQGEAAQDVDPNKDTEEKAGAPEEYKDFTMPEGMEADAELLVQFKPLAKELNLSQEGAQKLIDLYNDKLQGQHDASQEAWENVKKDWGEKSKNDKEFGGANFQENLSVARKALDQFGTPELKEAFDLTGVGNHPEFIRFMVRVGKAISEDGVVNGSNPKGAPRDPAKIMFPDMN